MPPLRPHTLPPGFIPPCLPTKGPKRKDPLYRSGRSPDWLKMKSPACEAVKREAEEDWGR